MKFVSVDAALRGKELLSQWSERQELAFMVSVHGPSWETGH